MVEKKLDLPVKGRKETEGISKTPKSRTQVYRHELKYFISFTNQKILSEAFRHTMETDPNGNEDNEYWIRSLYFDTMGNSDFYDKEIGIKTRKKIRLRIYNVEQPWVKIEIKNKYEQYMLKETAALSRDEARALIRGEKEVLLNHGNPTLNRVFYYMAKDLYKPAVIIDYEREAYVGSIQDIRITFDKNIRASGVDFDIFNPDLNMQPVFEYPTMVVEVKYNRFMPSWIKEMLAGFHSERYAISKYCLGRYIY
ncbi:MAG: polyphosphate polymerase domain-containing protein [bacterium]|nr:polyphosphate polymerase domain-containing protein [bacterium]